MIYSDVLFRMPNICNPSYGLCYQSLGRTHVASLRTCSATRTRVTGRFRKLITILVDFGYIYISSFS